MKRCGCGDSQEKGTDDMHLVVHITGMVKILGGKSALQARHPHSKGHRIKIDEFWVGLTLGNFLLFSILIDEQRHIDLNLPASPQPDVLG